MKKQSEMNGTNFLNAQKNSQFKDMVRRLFKNKAAVAGLFFLIFLILMAIFADALFDYNTQCINQNIPERLQWPSAQHWFGTDEYGRDLLIRIVFGSRISLSIGFIAVLFGLIVGGVLGAVAGFFGGKIDNIIMRLCDVFLAVPMMLMAIVIVAALGASIVNLVIALSISSVPTFARIVRSAVLTVRDMDYVEAARAIGVKTPRILARYILPNCMGPIIVQATMSVSNSIIAAASLSFIGLGVNAPMPSLGSLANSARQGLQTYPYKLIFPALMICLIVLSLNLLGDGLRDAFDPKLKR